MLIFWLGLPCVPISFSGLGIGIIACSGAAWSLVGTPGYPWGFDVHLSCLSYHPCVRPSIPARPGKRESILLLLKWGGKKQCGTKSKLRLLDLYWAMQLCRFNLYYSTGSINIHLITNCYLEMLKIVWKIISLRKKNPKWETGAT